MASCASSADGELVGWLDLRPGLAGERYPPERGPENAYAASKPTAGAPPAIDSHVIEAYLRTFSPRVGSETASAVCVERTARNWKDG
jgi:hypothetical protein